jgi:histidinol-phosphatase (PHP family)
MGDYHVHLHPHGAYQGVGPALGEYPPGHIESYVEAAAARGAEEVGFTEHLYRCVESATVLGDFWSAEPKRDLAEHTEAFVREDRTLSLVRYVEAVTDAKDRGLPVLLGLEVDFFPDSIDAVLDLLDPYPWDFLIGSVHWVGGWSIDNVDVVYEFDRRGVREAYEDYFDIETRLAASGAVDVLAHVDVAKKSGRHLPRPPIDLYRRVVEAAAASGTAVEVSTAGLYQPAGEMYPSAVFLRMFHDAGVPITLASDAHVPADCARDRNLALRFARDAGYEFRTRFRARRPTMTSLERGAPTSREHR